MAGRVVERRAAPRVATALRGKVFPGAVDCRIADFTRKGARLTFEAAAPAGERFVLVVWASGAAFEALVRWRRGRELGVRLEASRDLRRPAPAHLAEAQALWVARRPRVRRTAIVNSPVILRARSRLPHRIAAPREG